MKTNSKSKSNKAKAGYTLSKAAKAQRKQAAKKSAEARHTNDKWRTCGVTESIYQWAVTKYGSVNEALRHYKGRAK